MNPQHQLLRAVQQSTRKLASSGNFDLLLRDVLHICVEAVGAEGGTIYLHEPLTGRLRFQHVLPTEILSKFPSLDIPDDFGIAGAAFKERKTIARAFMERPESERNEFEKATGVVIRSIVATPLLLEDEIPIGVVQLINKVEGPFTEEDVAVLDTIAAVSTMAYINSRLSEESSRASTLLGMGKVSHDIGNLAASLYANLNFADFAMTGLKEQLAKGCHERAGEFVGHLDPAIDELKQAVDRIVGYSRLISDMSAGKTLRPNMVAGPLSESIRAAAAYLESECRANNVKIVYEIEEGAPPMRHDPLYIIRIVQNLVGNAIKAVKETHADDTRLDEDAVLGEIVVRYQYDKGRHIVEVSDSGPGMSRAIVERILTGNARSQWERGGGSGWGTKIVLELAATHAAEVSIDSVEGSGTTFRVSLPNDPSKLEAGLAN